MKLSTLDTLIWVLVYGGLLTVSIGVFVLRGGSPGLGWTLVALGTAATVTGAGLVAVRARLEPPPAPPSPGRRPPP